MERFCRRRCINNLILVTVSLYPLHSDPFNVTITRITRFPRESLYRAWKLISNSFQKRNWHGFCNLLWTSSYGAPFQDNWFSITYTQSATTRYFSCQVVSKYDNIVSNFKLMFFWQNPRERDEWIASLRKTLQPAEDRRLELIANILKYGWNWLQISQNMVEIDCIYIPNYGWKWF